MNPAAPPPVPPPLRRLSWILAICVGLGAAGVVFGLSTVLSRHEPLVLGELPELEPPEGEEESWAPVIAAFEKLPEAQLAVLRKHRPALTALAAVDLVASAVLLVGALWARRRTPRTLRILVTGLVLSQAYAALKLFLHLQVQLDAYRALGPTLQEVARQGEIGGAAAQAVLFAQTAAIAIMVGIALLELGFYIYAHRFVRKPVIAGFLSGEPVK